MFAGMAGVAFVMGAYLRGNYLLGIDVGIWYAAVALMMVGLFARVLWQTPVSKIKLALLVLFTIPVCFGFAFPAFINPDVQVFVSRHKQDRVVRSELRAVFGEDPAFSSLSISTTQLKILNVEISGSVPRRADLTRLRHRVFEHCGSAKGCHLDWRIQVRDDGKTYVARNNNAFAPE